MCVRELDTLMGLIVTFASEKFISLPSLALLTFVGIRHNMNSSKLSLFVWLLLMKEGYRSLTFPPTYTKFNNKKRKLIIGRK